MHSLGNLFGCNKKHNVLLYIRNVYILCVSALYLYLHLLFYYSYLKPKMRWVLKVILGIQNI